MLYPLRTPENVSRDMIDVLGGYNHNLRIGDGEFFDMENLSSDSYPLLSVRKKRQSASALESYYSVVDMFCFADDMYYVVQADTVGLYRVTKEPHFIALWDSDYHSMRQTVIMGSKAIILPDQVMVNFADLVSDSTKNAQPINNNRAKSSGSVSVQPCLASGEVLSIDYVGDTVTDTPYDGYVWLDTRSSPASLKKYYATQSTWQPFLSTHVKITAEGIAEGFKVGDGVKITGFTEDKLLPLNNTVIISAIPDDDSVVITGVIDVMPDDSILTAQYNQSRSSLLFYCDKHFPAGAFSGKRMQLSNRECLCTSSTEATEVTAIPIISSENLNTDSLTLTALPTAGSTSHIAIEQPIDKYIKGRMICFGNIANRNFAQIISQGANQGATEFYIVIDQSVQLSESTTIYPIEYVVPEGKYGISLTFSEEVSIKIDEKACPSLDNQYTQTLDSSHKLNISRKMPKMDFVIENQNRLWGCRYGENNDNAMVNEIYCSKLGDPTNWSVYEGLSTDSYAASCGTDGEWTGAINYRGYPTFFKEHYIHTVYGSNPPFQIKDTPARGVQKDCSDSLAIVNEVLFYKSTHGICAYTGGLPEEISMAFGEVAYLKAIACAYRGKYYVDMLDSDSKEVLMVYDTTKRMWHKEQGLGAKKLVSSDNNVFFIASVGNINGVGRLFGTNESAVKWYAETGLFGLNTPDKKYISKINLRIMLPVSSAVFISIEYDSSGVWEQVCSLSGHSTMPFSLPIKPRRCDHFRLRLEGIGDMKLYSICKTIEQGSDR